MTATWGRTGAQPGPSLALVVLVTSEVKVISPHSVQDPPTQLLVQEVTGDAQPHPCSHLDPVYAHLTLDLPGNPCR